MVLITICNNIIVVQVKTVAVDFVNDDETSYRLKIAREIEGKSIKVGCGGENFAFTTQICVMITL